MEPNGEESARVVKQFRMLKPSTALPGTLYKFQQPVIVAVVETSNYGPTLVKRLDEALASQFPNIPDRKSTPDGEGILDTLLRWYLHLQRAYNHPVFDNGCIRRLTGENTRAHLLVAPYFDARAAQQTLAHIFGVAENFLLEDGVGSEVLANRADGLHKALTVAGIKSLNTVHYLEAAHTLSIPWEHINGHIFRIGQGRYARLLKDSATDRTSAIGLNIARSKTHTANLLGSAGFPVPQQKVVTSTEEAFRAASAIGYPVVVKPLSEDGGSWVTAGISDENEVAQACAKLPPDTRSFLLEKHIDGKDYRMPVINNKVEWAVERTPCGVTGNGNSTVRELISNENKNPLRGPTPNTPLYPIAIDEDLTGLLKKNGMSLDFIPEHGKFIRLRTINNVNVGGVPVAVPLDTIHPDNIRMAERAVTLLGLDLAGVDLLIPDITKPWHTQQCAINEVNGYPTIGTYTAGHLYSKVIREMVQNTDGRVPLIAVVSREATVGAHITQSIYKVLAAKMPNTALANSQGAWIDDELVAVGDQGGFNGAKVLLAAKNCDRAVLAIMESDISKLGFPVNSCDVSIYMPQSSSPIESIAKSFLDNIGKTLICTDEHFPAFKHHLQDMQKELIIVSQKSGMEKQEEQILAAGATLFRTDGSSIMVASKNLNFTIPHVQTDTDSLLFIAAALWSITRDESIFAELGKLERNQ